MGVTMFIATAIAAYRNFSTKSFGKNTKSAQSWYRSKNKPRKSEPRNPRTRIKWTDQQKKIISAVSAGSSVFITGSAGTGKTELVKHIIELLKKCHSPSGVFVTASTGVAACAIRGQTLHSFAGIGYPMADRRTLLDRVLQNKRAYRRWNKAEALVIDEISMVDAELFESLEYIAKKLRGGDEVWGGIQLVVSGDFFQLPPVFGHQNSSGKVFAFEADCWNASFDMQLELTEIFRQSDARFVKMLQGIRRGDCDPQDLEVLEQLCSRTESDELDPSVVQLYPLKEDVRRVNETRMESFSEAATTYLASDSGENPWKIQLKEGIAPDELFLCEGARVMLIKNLNTWRGLVNGNTGTVIGFSESEGVDVRDICSENRLPIVKFDSGPTKVIEPETWVVTEGDTVVAKRKQLPLLLAWARSIHKCQGMTLDKLHTNLSRAFGCGMVYVALSRVRSLEGLQLSGFSPSKIKAHPKVLQFYKSFACEPSTTKGTDEGANKIRFDTSGLVHVSNTTNKGASEYHFSLSEFISSRQKRK
ncbi:ATP-dependent DNA helicase PIF1-like [Juglans microcarpa x Juglans regia]|uniref:ATP-dependent DNA helicase PIF1-like n=1 Tax=Juglans microcarpa x Juglans regia TaxID=2249226 RepID=UPI001B7E57D9|nr:ATP-dependent DNA helicase PIF1-like [Juglans microcarpa x Juglans regia]